MTTRGTEPYYSYSPDGKIVPTACLSRQPSGYGRAPSACAVDSVMAQQVAHKHELVHPHEVGPAAAAPVATAASRYIYGDPPTGTTNPAPQPGVLVRTEPIPAE
ncbi:MAG: hypothetical protein AAFY03_01220 [Pseudomonadota bacterium]